MSTAGSRESSASSPSLKGRTIFAWSAIGVLTLAVQIVLRRELAPGEFGTMNALFGVTLVFLAPMAALSHVLRRTLAGAGAENLHPPLLNRVALGWGIGAVIACFLALPALRLPRASLQFYTPLVVAAGLLAICARPVTAARWCAALGLGAALLRLIVSAWAGHAWPCAESGLAALVLAGLLAGLPALGEQPGHPSLAPAWPTLRPALVPGLAAVSVAFALALFTNADRIAAQPAFGLDDATNLADFAPRGAALTLVDAPRFDDYQAAGLLARYLLWGLLPLLLLLQSRRAALAGTTRASLHWFWIYLAALVAGVVLMVVAAPLANVIFTGDPAAFLPNFAGAVFLLGLLQGFAVFALASRRWTECFVIGATGIAYAFFLFYAGRQPQLMTSYMCGGALICLMLVLFIGVVRYARSHP